VRVLALVVVIALVGCKPEPRGQIGQQRPTPSPSAAAGVVLTPADVAMYLAVKRKALSRLEEALDRLERTGGDPLQELGELSRVEREAAQQLGFDPGHFGQVREQMSRLATLRAKQEQTIRLEEELARSKKELIRQREATRDRATREFLDAQIRTLDRELARLAAERSAKGQEQEALAVLGQFRVEMAQLEARQERLTRRIREVWVASRKRQGGAPRP